MTCGCRKSPRCVASHLADQLFEFNIYELVGDTESKRHQHPPIAIDSCFLLQQICKGEKTREIIKVCDYDLPRIAVNALSKYFKPYYVLGKQLY